MDDIDYGAVFGISETGVEEQEAAEPAADTGAQGAKEQEPAEPAVDEQTQTGESSADDDATGADEDSQDEPEQGEKDEPGAQPKEKNAKFAAARRKAEQERDAAVAQAKQEAQAEAQRVIDEAFANSGLTNPYTKKPITTKAEYDEYRQRFDAEKKARVLKKSGMTDDEFNEFVAGLPEVREAKEKSAQAETAQKQAQEAQAKLKVDEQLKEISAIDPTIKELADIAKMPTYERFYELVKRGNSLTDAFKLANLDKLTQTAAQASKQAAVNAAAGKGHMTRTATRGAGAVSVPQEVREEYLAFNPGATDAEIAQHYNKYIKK